MFNEKTDFVLWAVCFGGSLFIFWRVTVVIKKFYTRLFDDMEKVEGFFGDEVNRKKLKKAATDIIADGLERGVVGIYEKITQKRKEEIKNK